MTKEQGRKVRDFFRIVEETFLERPQNEQSRTQNSPYQGQQIRLW